MITDKERLDWLEHITNTGACPGLIFDDDGRWAVAFDGVQPVPLGNPEDMYSTFFIRAKQWKGSVRKAIDYAIGVNS